MSELFVVVLIGLAISCPAYFIGYRQGKVIARIDADVDEHLIERMSGLLAEIVYIVKGEAPTNGSWGYQDLPQLVLALKLRAEAGENFRKPVDDAEADRVAAARILAFIERGRTRSGDVVMRGIHGRIWYHPPALDTFNGLLERIRDGVVPEQERSDV